MTDARLKNFRAKVWRYYRQHKRDLPWRKTNDPYKILVSEIMLQQTQVDRVIPKYRQFLAAFPTARALAAARLGEVLKHWQGLGYNRRALLLQRAAQEITKQRSGRFPRTESELRELPGLGPYTAAAVAAFAFNQPTVLIETNIRTVFLHEFFRDQTNIPDTKLLPLISTTISQRRAGEWYQALMDYGAYLKKEHGNINRRSAHYTRQSAFAGSNRQLRGLVIKALSRQPSLSLTHLKQMTKHDQRLEKTLQQLAREGFITLPTSGHVTLCP